MVDYILFSVLLIKSRTTVEKCAGVCRMQNVRAVPFKLELDMKHCFNMSDCFQDWDVMVLCFIQ